MDKPIPEAVRAIRGVLFRVYMEHDDFKVTTALLHDMAVAVSSLTAAQQQGQAVAIEGTDAEVLREFIRICREHKPVGQWPGERVCAAIERSMANERPFRFIAEADMAPEREPSMKDADRALSGPRRNDTAPPSAPVGVEIPSVVAYPTATGGTSRRVDEWLERWLANCDYHEALVYKATIKFLRAIAQQPAPSAPVGATITNPWTGKSRDYRDVDSDPEGVLCVEPGAPLKAATSVEGLTTKEAWWAGYRAGKGLPADTPRQEALAQQPAAVGLDPPVERQRDMLAQAIRDAAVKAGIARADADMTGPMLLMLCDDLADCALATQHQEPTT